jgi:hypothetical protein
MEEGIARQHTPFLKEIPNPISKESEWMEAGTAAISGTMRNERRLAFTLSFRSLSNLFCRLWHSAGSRFGVIS